MVYFVVQYTGFTNVLLTVTSQTVYGTRANATLFTPIRKIWPPLCWFLWNSHMFNNIMCQSPVQNSIQIGQKWGK